jgi:hypothetical protein
MTHWYHIHDFYPSFEFIVIATVCRKQYPKSVDSSSYCKAEILELCFDLDFSGTSALFVILGSIFCCFYCHYRHHLGSLAHSNST